MNVALFEFMLRSVLFLSIFLCMAYFLFRHIEYIKKTYGKPEDGQNYMAILKHYFFRKFMS